MTYVSSSITSITNPAVVGSIGHVGDHNEITAVIDGHDTILSQASVLFSSSALLGSGSSTIPSSKLMSILNDETGTGVFVMATSPTISSPSVTGTLRIPQNSSTSSVGQFGIGLTPLTAAETNVMAIMTDSVNSYSQFIMQNFNSGSIASTDLVMYSDNTPAGGATNYLNIGRNSSGFVSGGNPFNDTNGGYLYNDTGTLTLGTTTAHSVRLVGNNSVALTVTGSNSVFAGSLTASVGTTTVGTLNSGNISASNIVASGTASVTGTLTATANSVFGNISTNNIYNQGFTGPYFNFTSSNISLRTQNSGTNKGLVIQSGSTSQTANLQEWQNSGGTVLGSVGASGLFAFTSASLGAGTATIPALALTSGVTLTTPVAGAVEYDGTVAYLTTNTAASSRGIIPNLIFVTTASNRSLSAASTAQTIFDSTNDIISLAANTTYAVEMFFTMYNTATSSVAYTENLIFSTTGTPTYSFYVNYTGASANPSNNGQTTYTAWTTASTTTLGRPGGSSSGVHSAAVFVKGLIRTTTSATFSPLIAFSAVPNPSSGSILANAYMHLNPIGSSAVVGLPAWQ